MLELTGDILNWLAAGVVFPLMLLPLALALKPERNTTVTWLALIAAAATTGVLFAWLVPVISVTPQPLLLLKFAGMSLLSVAIAILCGGAARFATLCASVFSFVTRRTSLVVMWFLLLMALVQFAVVVLRYVFGINYIFMQESITYMHGGVFLLAAGYALLTNDHVRVDIFYRGASEKRRALIDFLGSYFLLFPVCLLLLWTASPYVANSWAVGEGSNESSGIQAVFIMKSFIPAFAVLLAMAGFNIAARAGSVLKGRG
ncbi:TRAP transporter small permease subunit [Hyphococcus flavus]|uniref:TRAP transporter small permease protein n=1 Tax=Hyphococcus flavus TaxID=1866326 RepID=A0AAE9ZB27_9PROT|nr:TRAP transporter small permease subunit [Hyphococcus flavus]WDI30691.1 TRAP transporter small permease subunit [Hyphococcus flavus]